MIQMSNLTVSGCRDLPLGYVFKCSGELSALNLQVRVARLEGCLIKWVFLKIGVALQGYYEDQLYGSSLVGGDK